MQFKQLCALVLITACNATVDDPAGGGDDTVGPGGPGEPGGPGAGTDTVRFRLTSIHDERGDQIDFSTCEPVHTHAGAAVQLGGEDCPDVYKHAYLMDATPPKFGRETTPNTLAWTVEANGAAEYRVRRTDDSVALDWTPVANASITLYRDSVTSGKYFLDARVGDEIATTCWNHHALAAPIEIHPAQPTPTGLIAMTLPANSSIGAVISGSATVPVFEQQFVHHTAEPVTLAIELAPPTGMYTKRVAEGYAFVLTGPTNVTCATDAGFVSSDPLCTEPEPPLLTDVGVTTSGTLATGTWAVRVVDESTGTIACTVTGLRATCQLPARATTEAARSYRLTASVTNLRDLAPASSGAIAEHTIRLNTFTGQRIDADTKRACTEMTVKILPDGSTADVCRRFASYTYIIALDHARVAFDAVPFSFTADGNPLAASAMPAFAWDAGDDDLPGQQ